MTKKALITGITGQDGSYLAEFLAKKKDMRFMVLKEERRRLIHKGLIIYIIYHT